MCCCSFPHGQFLYRDFEFRPSLVKTSSSTSGDTPETQPLEDLGKENISGETGRNTLNIETVHSSTEYLIRSRRSGETGGQAESDQNHLEKHQGHLQGIRFSNAVYCQSYLFFGARGLAMRITAYFARIRSRWGPGPLPPLRPGRRARRCPSQSRYR